jgi:hypothetical protein
MRNHMVSRILMRRTSISTTNSTPRPATAAAGTPAVKNKVVLGNNVKEKKGGGGAKDRTTIINQHSDDKISRISQVVTKVRCLGTTIPIRQKETTSNATGTPFGTRTTTEDDAELNNSDITCKPSRSKTSCSKNINPFRFGSQRTGYHFIKRITSNALKKTRRRRKFISLTRTFLEFYDTSNNDGTNGDEGEASTSGIQFQLSKIFATTPLHIACEEGQPPETIASIIALGIPVNITDDRLGRVPLHYAVESICKGVAESVDEGIKTVKMLCSKDAKLVHQMDRNLDTPIDIIHDTIVTTCRPTSKIPREEVRNKFSSYYCSKKGIFPTFCRQHPHPAQRNKVSHQDLERLYLELKKISIDVYREQKRGYEAKGQSIKSFAKVEDHVLNTNIVTEMNQ